MQFKCKICGGSLKIDSGKTVATCEYCGTQQTLPKLGDDHRLALYDRANQFRRSNEFDKAMGIYEQILLEDNSDAEAYWSLVLCRYGIEYVEDPATGKRLPTVNRAQFTSVFDDDNYRSALNYADSEQKHIYEEEAKAINEIQKGILAISQKEEPFDVFICYKETDHNGRRTPDSVLANDLYHQLTQEGFKVFFSRITLEDKLGAAYEPYIFAALNSSKVMVVLGTKPEYFSAVWVRNEWSRYIGLIKQGQKKLLIPAYRDMNPYDLPEEFSHLQALDMSRLGFMQDLIRGIKKIIQLEQPAAKPRVEEKGTNTQAVLKRAFLFLEDGDWDSADEYCEKVLDKEPENAEAYLGKLLAELKLRKTEDLQHCTKAFNSSSNYQKAVRFADKRLKAKLEGYSQEILKTRNKKIAIIAAGAATVAAILVIILCTAVIPGSKYKEAVALMDAGKYNEAIVAFEALGGYKDSGVKISQCNAAIDEQKLAILDGKYNDAVALMDAGKYTEAIAAFEAIGGHKDSVSKIDQCNAAILDGKYNDAVALMTNGNAEEAYERLVELGDYKDAKELADGIRHFEDTKKALQNVKTGDYIKFGTYEQDDNSANGAEEIEWLVLEVKEGKALVISKDALDCKPYNTSLTDVTWETCSLRAWLNNEFVNTAFTAQERALIPTRTVSADKNTDLNISSGRSTQDQVFVLSVKEAKKYFKNDIARQCALSEYALANGAFTHKTHGNCWWWLRTTGESRSHATSVLIVGNIAPKGHYVNTNNVAVRPAMWIDLNV